MAVLEKIRSKSVLLFTIIIVALLAFILGDFFNSGRSLFGPGDTVAKANGAKVKLQDYQKLYAELNEQMKGQNNDIVEEQAIFQLLREALLKDEYDRLGITVTENELSQFMLDAKTSPMVLQLFCMKAGIDNPNVLMQLGFTNTTTLLDAVNNPAKYKIPAETASLFKNAWKETENEVDKQIRLVAYSRLLNGLLTANKVDAQQIYDERATSTTYSFVAKEYSSVPDDKVKITDQDYKNYYDQHMGEFKLSQDSRYIHYISVPIVPSQADITAIDNEMQTLVGELATAEDVSKTVRAHKNFEYNNLKTTRAKLASQQNSPLQSLAFGIDSVAVGAAKQLPTMANTYSAYKLIGTSMGIDSVTYTLYPVENAAKIDSVMATVTTGTIDSLARMVNPQLVEKVESLVGAEPDNKLAKLLETGETNTLLAFSDTIQNQPFAAIIDIKKRSNPVTVYELGIATYQLLPSGDTEKNLAQKLRNYVGNNGKCEAFVKNAAKAGYTVDHALVNPSTPIGNGAPNSMSVLKWAMEADKGAVSKVSMLSVPQNPNAPGGPSQYLLAVAVDEIYDDDYIPANSAYVKEVLKPYLLDLKKAQYVMDQYKGKAKTIEEAATLFGAKVNIADASFGQSNNSPEMLAAIATAKENTLVGPIKGNGQVYFIQVSKSSKQGRPFNFDEAAANFRQANLGTLFDQTGAPSINLLVGDNKITNNILEFTNGEEK